LIRYRFLMIGSFLLLHCLSPSLFAEEKIGLGELDRLIKIHKPKKPVEGFDATVGPKKSVQLLAKGEPTVFRFLALRSTVAENATGLMIYWIVQKIGCGKR